MKKLLFITVLAMIIACAEAPKKPKPPTNGYFYEYKDDKVDTLNFKRYLYKNGIVVQEMLFVDGKVNGEAKEYYLDGKLRSTIEYKDAKRNGMFVMYYETGEKYSETPYENGKEQGISQFYKKDGAVTAKVKYETGVPVPPLEEFDSEGKPIQQPKIKFRTSGGSLKMELDDKSFKATQFYTMEKNGKLVKIPTAKGEGVLVSFQSGTKVRAVYTSKRGREGAVDARY
ncbi:MAG: hypothetical protein LBD59_08865 [Prevotellaceae bacterium]|nr:hypothetical protein [Prevotellaceae bacterium]